MNRTSRPRSRWLAFAIPLVALASLASCGDDDPEPKADEVLAEYEAAYDAHDLDAVMVLFSDDAVITGHPLRASAEGTTEVRELQEIDIAASAANDPYEIVVVETNGNSVTFDHTWRSTEGECFAGTGHTIVAENGSITRWDWGSSGLPCQED